MSKFPKLTGSQNEELYQRQTLKFPTRAVVSAGPCDVFSCDLYDLNNKPDGEYHYIFNAIDVFSRKWGYSLMKDKSFNSIKFAIADIISQLGKPRKIWFDGEASVWSKENLSRLELMNIHLYSTNGHSVMVERFHRTLGGLLVKN